MHISLVGMSNIGKSYCARNLAHRHGYTHIDCDAEIEKRLGEELTKHDFRGIHGMAKWMGFPDKDYYLSKSRRYVACERETMLNAFAKLERADKSHPIVLDTTGSVVYTGDDILDALRAHTQVIYFEASESQIEALYKTFIEHPKPVIWGDNYKPQPGETPQETLKRCYPELLRDRARRYKKAAHIVLPFEEIKKHWADIGTFVLDALS